MPRSPRALLYCAAALSLSGAVLLPLACPGRAAIDSPEALAQHLQESGSPYELRYVEQGEENVGGHYLKRRDDARPWEVLARNPARTAAAMPGYAALVPHHKGMRHEEGYRLGAYWLVGDPKVVEEITAGLR